MFNPNSAVKFLFVFNEKHNLYDKAPEVHADRGYITRLYQPQVVILMQKVIIQGELVHQTRKSYLLTLTSNACTYSPASANATIRPAGCNCPPNYILLPEGNIIPKLSLCQNDTG